MITCGMKFCNRIYFCIPFWSFHSNKYKFLISSFFGSFSCKMSSEAAMLSVQQSIWVQFLEDYHRLFGVHFRFGRLLDILDLHLFFLSSDFFCFFGPLPALSSSFVDLNNSDRLLQCHSVRVCFTCCWSWLLFDCILTDQCRLNILTRMSTEATSRRSRSSSSLVRSSTK